jgi:coenzyme F420-0:L-glutamate ligase/coenzyme F420-1:gamma-L-glutamate ligase
MSTPTDRPADLHAFLRTRRSVRRFRPEPVAEETVQRLLKTAVCAPSAHNDQPWRFAIVPTAASKARLAQAMADEFQRDLRSDGLLAEEIAKRLERSQRRIQDAPLVVVLCLQHADDPAPGTRRLQAERIMAVQSAALGGLKFLLAAHAEGLGGVWTCGPLFAPQAVRSALDLPEGWEPQGMLLIGYPAETPAPPAQKPVEQIAIWRLQAGLAGPN